MDAAVILHALGAAFPGLYAERCVLLGEGWDSQVWAVNDTLVFRFPKRDEVADWLRREIALLPTLASALPVPIPQFTHIAATGSPLDPALPFVGYPILRGTFLHEARDHLLPDSPLIAQLAAFLGALHLFPVAQAEVCGVPPGTWGAWSAHWHAFAAQVAAAGPETLDAATRAWSQEVLHAFLTELALAERPVALIHHDLALEHVLVDPGGQRLTGVIDWGDVAVGDPALDFAGFIADRCPSATIEALLSAYPRSVDERFLARAAWYARLAPFHLLAFGLHIADPATIARGVAAIRELRATWDEA